MYTFIMSQFLIYFYGECMMRKIIVVGAVAGGATCASQIRRLDKDSEITILKRPRHEFRKLWITLLYR